MGLVGWQHSVFNKCLDEEIPLFFGAQLHKVMTGHSGIKADLTAYLRRKANKRGYVLISYCSRRMRIEHRKQGDIFTLIAELFCHFKCEQAAHGPARQEIRPGCLNLTDLVIIERSHFL